MGSIFLARGGRRVQSKTSVGIGGFLWVILWKPSVLWGFWNNQNWGFFDSEFFQRTSTGSTLIQFCDVAEVDINVETPTLLPAQNRNTYSPLFSFVLVVRVWKQKETRCYKVWCSSPEIEKEKGDNKRLSSSWRWAMAVMSQVWWWQVCVFAM